MKVLVTGTRAPASMDLMRSLIQAGFQVYSADSMTFPLGRFVKGIEQHFTLPKPNRNTQAFINGLKALIIEHSINLVIPTCEEIFFVSQGYEDLSQHTRIFCEPFQKLLQLHNKFAFNQLVHEYGLDAPKSWLLNTHDNKSDLPLEKDLVLKPLFSRFGAHVLLKPPAQVIQDLSLKVPYVAQEFIEGKEYCSYAIAVAGKVVIQSCYHPKYTSGPAAGIYFEPASIKAITQFVSVFCEKYHFSGQIAFDFIVKEKRAYVLECNPRITSGFHFLADSLNWPELLQGIIQSNPTKDKPYMLGLAMTLYGRANFWSNPKMFIKDYKKAQDVLKSFPWLAAKSLLTMANIGLRMIKERKNFHEASTDDIEFNG